MKLVSLIELSYIYNFTLYFIHIYILELSRVDLTSLVVFLFQFNFILSFNNQSSRVELESVDYFIKLEPKFEIGARVEFQILVF